MASKFEIQPVVGPVDASICPPGSKSITNRALVCAALAKGESNLTGALDSEDTRAMIAGLSHLGIKVDVRDAGRSLRVVGASGKVPAERAEIFVGNSGTTIRFLTALAALGHGEYRLDGIARMRERPIGDLADALEHLGSTVSCESPGRCPPVVVNATGLAGGSVCIRGDISSQFLSGLLMAVPCASEPISLQVVDTLVSVPYVEMTLRVMEAFGVAAEHSSDYSEIRVSNPGHYLRCDYAIEPDASAASYFWAIAAVTGGSVTVENLTTQSLQGDVRFVDCLEQMGCSVVETAGGITVQGGNLRGVELDMNNISDTVQTLAVVALFAEGPTRIRNVAHIRHKETDRISAVATELRKLGARVEEFPDGLAITPGPLRSDAIDTYNDHRMAMSFAIAGLRVPGVVICDPECTAKTYPEFFTDLSRLVGRH